VAIHVAILKPKYLRMILAGSKTVESRFTKTDRPPFHGVTTGELIHLKESGGPFVAVAQAGRVWSKRAESEQELRHVFDHFAERVGVDASYWPAVRGRQFVTMVELKGVERCDAAPRYNTRNMWAWYTLDNAASPVRLLTVSDGGLRNRYLRVPRQAGLTRGPLRLELPDGQRVDTELLASGMIRWRGWGPVFQAAHVTPDTAVRLIPISSQKQAFRVSFVQP